MYAGGSTGLAVLRRDGFVSMGKNGMLTTRAVAFSGRHLFVNAAAGGGEVAVEVVGELGFGVKDCVPVRADGTRQALRWNSGRDLSGLTGKALRLRFHLKRAELYSFWVSPDESGASHGFVAAGGPGLSGSTDTVGNKVI